VLLYCKNRDKFICDISISLFDHYICIWEQNACERTINCLSGVCDGFCESKHFNYDFLIRSLRDYKEYILGYFTYENVKKYFEK